VPLLSCCSCSGTSVCAEQRSYSVDVAQDGADHEQVPPPVSGDFDDEPQHRTPENFVMTCCDAGI